MMGEGEDPSFVQNMLDGMGAYGEGYGVNEQQYQDEYQDGEEGYPEDYDDEDYDDEDDVPVEPEEYIYQGAEN